MTILNVGAVWGSRSSLTLLVCIVILSTAQETKDVAHNKMYTMTEMQRYDGWYNNLGHPDWGSVESQLTRKTPAFYSDGVYMLAGEDRPSPGTLSRVFMKGEDGMPSSRNLTALFTFFGQVVTSEILMASEAGCPIELHKIKIDECSKTENGSCRYMPFHRAYYDSKTGQSPNSPREQINQMTSWIDGSFVYSTSEAWLNTMRSFENGALRSGDSEGHFPPRNYARAPLINFPPAKYLGTLSPERMFLLGDPRSNQNPALLAFGIVFFRWHNFQAKRIKEQHPGWSDEDIFQRARRWVIASLQHSPV